MTDIDHADELSALRAEVADLRNLIDDWMEATGYAIDEWGRDIHSRLAAAQSTEDQSRLAGDSPRASSPKIPGGHGHAANGQPVATANGQTARRTAAMSAMANGASVAEAAKLAGASERSCRRWRAEA